MTPAPVGRAMISNSRIVARRSKPSTVTAGGSGRYRYCVKFADSLQSVGRRSDSDRDDRSARGVSAYYKSSNNRQRVPMPTSFYHRPAIRSSARARANAVNAPLLHAPKRFNAVFCALCAFALTLFAAGCNTASKVNLPKVLSENPTSDQLINVVNANAAKIKSFHTTNGHVSVSNMPGEATCIISYKDPNLFRLIGSITMQGQVLDFGSNGQTFWFWTSLSDAPKEIYTCGVDKFQASQFSQMFPLDPSWFPEALGIVHIDPDEIVKGPYVDENESKRLVLDLKRSRPNGVYTEKIVFEPLTAEIKRQDIRDPSGRLICSVHWRSCQQVGDDAVVVPQRVEIRCPVADMSFTVDLGTPVLNDDSRLLDFAVPNKNDAKVVDLSGNNANSSAQSLEPPVTTPSSSSSASSASNAPQTPNNAASTASAASNGYVAPSVIDASTLEHGEIERSPSNALPAIGTGDANSGAGIVPFPSAANSSYASAQPQVSTSPSFTVAQETPIAAGQPQASQAYVPANDAGTVAFEAPNAQDVPQADLQEAPLDLAADPTFASNADAQFAPGASMPLQTTSSVVPETSYAVEESAAQASPTFAPAQSPVAANTAQNTIQNTGQNAQTQNWQAASQTQYQPTQNQQTQYQPTQYAQAQAQQTQARQTQYQPSQYPSQTSNVQPPAQTQYRTSVYPGLTEEEAARPAQFAPPATIDPSPARQEWSSPPVVSNQYGTNGSNAQYAAPQTYNPAAGSVPTFEPPVVEDDFPQLSF